MDELPNIGDEVLFDGQRVVIIDITHEDETPRMYRIQNSMGDNKWVMHDVVVVLGDHLNDEFD